MLAQNGFAYAKIHVQQLSGLNYADNLIRSFTKRLSLGDNDYTRACWG